MWPSQGRIFNERTGRIRERVVRDISFIHNSMSLNQLLIITMVLALGRGDLAGFILGIVAIAILLLDWMWIQSQTTDTYTSRSKHFFFTCSPKSVHAHMLILLNAASIIVSLLDSPTPIAAPGDN
jgi:hypothetical protein